MYISRHHQLSDQDAIFSLMESRPLGAWVCPAGGALVANHIPFLLDRHQGPLGTLVGHVARANPVWRGLHPDLPSVVMFQGPQSYITPGWYPGKQAHGRVVPTWDYAVAHAHGVARSVDDRGWMLRMLERLTAFHEAAQPAPWSVADAPADYIDRLLRSIVGIEIPIDRLEAKLKASQDEDLQDRWGTVAGLRERGDQEQNALSELVRSTLPAR